MKAAPSILLQYTHNILYLIILIENHNEKLHILSYLGLFKLCSDEPVDCKFQIMQLNNQVDNIFTTLGQSKPKCTKRSIIHSLFNFLFGTSNSAKEIEAFKNNMAILKEN